MKKVFSLLSIHILFLLPVFSSHAYGKVYIDLSAPAVKKLRIAVQEFKSTNTHNTPQTQKLAEKVKNELRETITSDLDFSGLFSVIEKEAFLEDPEKGAFSAEGINFSEWRMIGADTLIKGRFTVEDKRLTVEVMFFDAVGEKLLFGKKYVGSAENPMALAHYSMDELYRELTGRKGIFSTKLLFVSNKTGNKEVYTSDYDGKNVRPLTKNRSINLSPHWSPDGKKILYTSYKRGRPYLYMLDLRTGKEELLSGKRGLNLGGRFSPDGGKIALTLGTEKSPEVFLLDTEAKQYQRLTDNFGIDVSPTWSPNGGSIAFVSDMSGNPHIFVLDLAASRARRLTYEGKYNASPSWSPDGKKIAFARSNNGRTFDIWVMGADGSNAVRLTSSGNNKNPSWSPDSRYIVFSSSSGRASSLYIMQANGTGLVKLPTALGGEQTPDWSPFMH